MIEVAAVSSRENAKFTDGKPWAEKDDLVLAEARDQAVG